MFNRFKDLINNLNFGKIFFNFVFFAVKKLFLLQLQTVYNFITFITFYNFIYYLALTC